MASAAELKAALAQIVSQAQTLQNTIHGAAAAIREASMQPLGAIEEGNNELAGLVARVMMDGEGTATGAAMLGVLKGDADGTIEDYVKQAYQWINWITDSEEGALQHSQRLLSHVIELAESYSAVLGG